MSLLSHLLVSKVEVSKKAKIFTLGFVCFNILFLSVSVNAGNLEEIQRCIVDPSIDGGSAPDDCKRKGNQSNLHKSVECTVAEGSPLNDATLKAVAKAMKTEKLNSNKCIAYKEIIKIGGEIAWRANNPGNLGSKNNKPPIPGRIGEVYKPGKLYEAVFPDWNTGVLAQRSLYEMKYGNERVRDAVKKITPSNENDTEGYLNKLEKAGVNLDQTVISQIYLLMKAISKNEGIKMGTVVTRVP